MMTWLIAMCVLSDQPCYVSLSCFQFHCKQRIQLVQECFFSTKESNQTRNIMLHMPGILPCISFRIITTCTFRMSYITGIKRRFPYPVSITRTHKVSLRIEQVLIIISTFRKVSGIFFFSHTTCHVSCRIIIIYRFQG